MTNQSWVAEPYVQVSFDEFFKLISSFQGMPPPNNAAMMQGGGGQMGGPMGGPMGRAGGGFHTIYAV